MTQPEGDLEATVPYRVRFDECGPDGTLRTSGLLRYAQDVAWVHSERLGFGRSWYAERRLAWLVRSVDLAVLASIPTGRTLQVTTLVVGFRRVTARRRTIVRDEGATVAEILTDWAMTDARGLPARVPSDFERFLAGPGAPFVPTKVPLRATPADVLPGELLVRPQDLDPMDHVNNAVYLDYLEEALLAQPVSAGAVGALPRRYRLEYVAAASGGERIAAAVWPDRDQWAVRLSGAHGADLVRARIAPDPR